MSFYRREKPSGLLSTADETRAKSREKATGVVQRAPCILVDATVGNFLRMCLVGMKRVRYLSILWNQCSIIWIEIRSGEADSRVSGRSHAADCRYKLEIAARWLRALPSNRKVLGSDPYYKRFGQRSSARRDSH
ncbi:hypothetical protein EVAR_29995_1 [Eumeta japonica]|uniref:Uncharacterized protein n=1 Tax=Eumeta variegata TaxID=151549 RepID=A0A4C1VGN6_EUMVA|nr:hypothetical protein EVAR_29995_1 [Eumeta japonica]